MLSSYAKKVCLQALAGELDGGRLKFFADEVLLVDLPLAGVKSLESGGLLLNPVSGVVLQSGRATVARVFGRSGDELQSFAVGGELNLSNAELISGGSLSVGQFLLMVE